MPELPEVEIVRKSLTKKIRYKRVKKVIVRNKNLRIKLPNNFKEFLENKIIDKVSRFSKYLIINLPKDEFCLIHLGMSGTIHLINNRKKKSKYGVFCPYSTEKIELLFKSFNSDSPIRKVLMEVLFEISNSSSFVFIPLSEIKGPG